MKELPAIAAAYNQLAGILDAELQRAQQVSDLGTAERIANRQAINDSAYFLLVWGQFETKLNDTCVAAIAARERDAQWERRRAWDSLASREVRRIPLEERLALVLDRRGQRGRGFGRAIHFYGERNKIAHGRSLATGVDIPAVIDEIYQIASEMRN